MASTTNRISSAAASNGKTTLADVATATAVTQKTASLALRFGKGAPETVARVRKAASELGYITPGRRKKDGPILLMTPTESGSTYYLELALVIRELLRFHGYRRILIENAGGDPGPEIEAINDAIKNHAAGAILAAPRCLPEGIDRLVRAQVPTVMIGVRPELVPRDVLSVSVSNASGVFEAVRYLRQLGHSKIAYLRGRAGAFSDDQRFEGFCRAMTETHGQINERYVVALHAAIPDFRAGFVACDFLFGLPERPTAIVAYNDAMAMGCIVAASERGHKVPSDLSVVGHDDLRFAEFTSPPLSSIRIDRSALGRYVVDILHAAMKGEHPGNRTLEPVFVVRKSTGPPT